MSATFPSLLRGSAALALFAALGLTGCAHRPGLSHATSVWSRETPATNSAHRPGLSHATSVWSRETPATNSALLRDVGSLQGSLADLAPTVGRDEAHLTARCAIEYSQQLATEYHVVRPALLHNFLVNMGLKNRGLCFQWTEDLFAQLQALHLTTLELHWGIARAGTAREHNTVVVTARGAPFERGLVLDPWRHSGRLTWASVAADKYPWQQGEASPGH